MEIVVAALGKTALVGWSVNGNFPSIFAFPSLHAVLNQSIDTRYEHQLDDFGPPLATMELEQTGLARKLNGTANGVVNPLTEHLQDDDISGMTDFIWSVSF